MRRTSLLFPINAMVLLASVTIGLYFVFSIAQRTMQVYQLQREESQLQREIGGLQVRHQDLVAERERLENGTDVEKIAREDLNYIKPGETAVVVIPSPAALERARATTAPSSPQASPNWLAWWDWLFGR